jgi:hypothetical protein
LTLNLLLKFGCVENGEMFDDVKWHVGHVYYCHNYEWQMSTYVNIKTNK